MTLTTVIPSLRASIPDPLDATHWPDHTVATTTDVLVSAVSLTELSHLVGTPLIHVSDECRHAAAASPDAQSSVVITAVLSRRELDEGRIDVELDLGASCRGLDHAQARLIGRSSVHPAGRVQIHTRADRLRHPSNLPDDIAVGDLIALPWPGAHSLKEIREP